MSLWSQVYLQESCSPTMQFLTSFHDYSLAMIMMILMFVGVVTIFMITNSMVAIASVVTLIEVVWTTVPMIILMALVIPSLNILYYMEEMDPFLTFKVTGHQWYWSYELMDLSLEFDSYLVPHPWEGEFRLLDVDNRMVLPVNKDLRALISAADVIHCWTLPSVGVKVDAVPGRLNQLLMNIMRPSIIYGQCSEICGANHSFMPITVESLTMNYFVKWVNNF